MSIEDTLTTTYSDNEDGYIKTFCEIYKDEFTTPDPFLIFCKYLEQTARHFCCGKEGIFQRVRAMRIPWAKYILMNPEERTILLDTSTNNVIFFFDKKRNPHAVICSQLGGKLNLISSFAVGGKRAISYRKVKKPYKYYENN